MASWARHGVPDALRNNASTVWDYQIADHCSGVLDAVVRHAAAIRIAEEVGAGFRQ